MTEQVTTKQAAQMLQISTTTVTRLLASRQLTGRKKGLARNSPLLIDVDSIHNFLNRTRQR